MVKLRPRGLIWLVGILSLRSSLRENVFFLIHLKFRMNALCSVFACDCESQDKWLSAEDLVTLFAKRDRFYKIQIYSFGRLLCGSAMFSMLEIYISLSWYQSQLGRKSLVQARLVDLSINLRHSSTFSFSLHFKEVSPLPRRGTLIALYFDHFCFAGWVVKEKMGRSIAQVYFGYRWEARSYISP